MKNVIIGAGIILFLVGAIYFDSQRSAGDKFACAYPPFGRIENGMTSDAVTKVLGQPDQKVVKKELGGNQFGQGDLEQEIKSGWLYSLPNWDGGLEIYFDTQEVVVGKNCGNG